VKSFLDKDKESKPSLDALSIHIYTITYRCLQDPNLIVDPISFPND